MPLYKSSELVTATPGTFDLIIVGSGPAGLTIANELLESGLHIAVLESGGERRNARSSELNRIENVGHFRKPYEISRCRGVGGTSQLWTGQCGVFEEVDYQHRDWVPFSGWPIDHATLRPYVNRSSRYLGIKDTDPTGRILQELSRSFDAPPWNTDKLSEVIYQFSTNPKPTSPHLSQQPDHEVNAELLADFIHHGAPKAMDFGPNFIDGIVASADVHLITDATVAEVLANETRQKAEGVRLVTSDRQNIKLYARAIVIACGGIENARLLLASGPSAERSLGNARDQVGRYFTDHPCAVVAKYKSGTGLKVRRRLGGRWHRTHARKHIYKLGLRLSPEIQRKEGLLNASYAFDEQGRTKNALSTLADGIRGLKRGDISKKTARNILSSLGTPYALSRATIDRYWTRAIPLDKTDASLIGCFVEQELDPDSRVMLSKQSDYLGQHIAKIDWKISEAEYRTARRAADIFFEEVARLGYDTPIRPEWLDEGYAAWKETLSDRSHPMCATRMSEDPATGVVDANCQVHDVDGLFVAGGSVFATPGFMNPTQMIVALAIRLAEHLQTALLQAPVDHKPPATARPSGNRPLRVGFIGGGHRVKTVYAPVMSALSDHVEVSGVVTRSEESAKAFEETGWPGTTEPARLISDAKPDFLIVSVPGSAIESVYPKLLNHGIPLLVETPVTWSDLKGRKLLRKIGASGTIVGVAEQYPLLPEYQLWKKAIELGVIGSPQIARNEFGIYDYHGVAVARALLGTGRHQKYVRGTTARVSDKESWLLGSIDYDDGRVITHSFSSDFTLASLRPPGQMSIIGRSGALTPTGLKAKSKTDDVFEASVVRHTDGDILTSLSLDTPIGTIEWRNPFDTHALTDEQIAVAEHVRAMSLAVRYKSAPLYDAADALKDIECLSAMRYSARRNGRPVAFPYSALLEKSREKVTHKLNERR